MEQTSNQKANTIVIDDGSKEYNIQNQHGETLAVFRFRPSDTNIISRFEEVQKFFENFSTEENESVKECEQRVIERIDYLVGADTGSTFFSVLGPFSPMNNGKLFVEVCMDALRDEKESEPGKQIYAEIPETQTKLYKEAPSWMICGICPIL